MEMKEAVLCAFQTFSRRTLIAQESYTARLILFGVQFSQIVYNGLVYLIDRIYQFFMHQRFPSAELFG